MYALFLFTTHGFIDGSGLTDDENAGDPTIHGCTLTPGWGTFDFRWNGSRQTRNGYSYYFYLLLPTGPMNMTYNPYLSNLQYTVDDIYVL